MLSSFSSVTWSAPRRALRYGVSRRRGRGRFALPPSALPRHRPFAATSSLPFDLRGGFGATAPSPRRLLRDRVACPHRRTRPVRPASSSLATGAARNADGRTGSASAPLLRAFSSSSSAAASDEERAVRILYGSQGGTAQLFAMQLGDELEELTQEERPSDVIVSALNDPPGAPHELLRSGPGTTNVLITSVTGVGDPPDNCREFYEWIMNGAGEASGADWPEVRYAVFGCGNSVAHRENFNVVGKRLDRRLAELGARRVHALGLGDDSDCIDDDFDTWQDSLVQRLLSSLAEESKEEAAETHDDSTNQTFAMPKVESCWHAEDADSDIDRERRAPPPTGKYPRLILTRDPDGKYDLPREDMFHLEATDRALYKPGTKPLPVVSNRVLAPGGAEYVMREMRLSIEDHPDVTYEAGDHLLVYPRNPQCVVDSYLSALDGVNGSDLIEGVEPSEDGHKAKAYPHPFGVTVEETLMHCTDLSQPPSPAFARAILGQKDIRYKEDIASTRTTPIELIRRAGKILSLEELLFNLPPMQPRYYSIASSPMANPHQIYLTFRPVKYLTALGHSREGVCTSFMKQLQPTSVDCGLEDAGVALPRLPVAVNSNPSFRLPSDDKIPILLVAGGCGVAPIRSFIEERMHKASASNGNQVGPPQLGEAYVYLGFRSPRDEVYRSVVDAAVKDGVVTGAHITYAKSCNKADKSYTLVSEVVEEYSEMVYDLLSNQGAHIYLCGGARQFGAAIEEVLLRIFMVHGNMERSEAEDYLRTLIRDRRLQEDLAD